jgi:RNA polymerase sigma factor (sigma-70 family)
MEKSDEELIAACREGDEAAWSALVMRYQRLLYAVPRRAGLDEDAAADILQHVFLKLLENLPKIQQPAQIQAWLVTTARRETLHFLRRQQKMPQISIDAGEGDDFSHEEFSAGSALPDEILLEIEREHRVRTAVAALDGRCRDLIILLFYREPPPAYAEIAEALKMSEGSIGPTRARCLQKLLGILNSSGK